MNEEIKASVDSPAFRTEAEFAAYLDSLHETMPDGAVTNRKWGPAQRALAGLAASRAMLPVVPSLRSDTVTDSRKHGAWKRPIYYTDTINGKQTCRDDLWAITTEELRAIESRLATERSDGTCQGASPVAGWVSVEDERKPNEHQLVAVIGPAYGSFDKGRYVSSATYYNGEFFTEDGDMMHPPSHWADLPPAPDAPLGASPTHQQEQS